MREIKFRAWFDNGKGQDMLFVGDAFGTKHSLDCCKYAMEGQPVVLMQYTGLKDVNDVEIFEGDIIEAFGNKLLIHWEDSDASFFATSSDGFISESGQEWQGNCFVIGNIYQNPELME